jgi:hypothetical protein
VRSRSPDAGLKLPESLPYLAELGDKLRSCSVDVFLELAIVALPGYSRLLICVADYLAFLEQHTYDGSRMR